jgi:hypothetical protein
MKFSAKTYMQTGTFRDMTLARLQNSMADSPLAGFYHHAEYQNYFWTNVWTYVMFSASVGCCLFACVFVCRAQQEGEYDLQSPIKDILWRVGLSESIDSGNKALTSKGSGGSDDSKEKPLIGDDEEHFFV